MQTYLLIMPQCHWQHWAGTGFLWPSIFFSIFNWRKIDQIRKVLQLHMRSRPAGSPPTRQQHTKIMIFPDNFLCLLLISLPVNFMIFTTFSSPSHKDFYAAKKDYLVQTHLWFARLEVKSNNQEERNWKGLFSCSCWWKKIAKNLSSPLHENCHLTK